MHIDSRTLLQKAKTTHRVVFVFSAGRESNPSKCRCPVDTCCHQCKHWWLQIFIFPVEGKINADRFRLLQGSQQIPTPLGPGFFWYRHRNRTHFNAICRGQIAPASSKTGGNIYLSFPLRERKMQIDSGAGTFGFAELFGKSKSLHRNRFFLRVLL